MGQMHKVYSAPHHIIWLWITVVNKQLLLIFHSIGIKTTQDSQKCKVRKKFFLLVIDFLKFFLDFKTFKFVGSQHWS